MSEVYYIWSPTNGQERNLRFKMNEDTVFMCRYVAVTLTLYLCEMDNRREVKCSGRQFIDHASVFLCTFLQSCNCHAIVGKRFALFTIILYRLFCCFVFDSDDFKLQGRL